MSSRPSDSVNPSPFLAGSLIPGLLNSTVVEEGQAVPNSQLTRNQLQNVGDLCAEIVEGFSEEVDGIYVHSISSDPAGVSHNLVPVARVSLSQESESRRKKAKAVTEVAALRRSLRQVAKSLMSSSSGDDQLGAPLSSLDDETLLRVAVGCGFQPLGLKSSVQVFREKIKSLEGARARIEP